MNYKHQSLEKLNTMDKEKLKEEYRSKTKTTNDELVALWDGWKIGRSVYCTGWKHPNLSPTSAYHISEMKYRTSFDWIMPVFQKINSGAIDDYTCIHIDTNTVFVHLKDDDMQDIPINGDLIGAIYKSVVIVLRWVENRKV